MPLSVVMDADRIGRSLARIGHEILERNRAVEELALVHPHPRRTDRETDILKSSSEINQHDVPTGALDITLYRDDLMRHPSARSPSSQHGHPVSIDDKRILLVDDVLYTGRTIRRRARRADRVRPSAERFNWSCWWIAAIGSCRSRPTTSEEPADVARRRACRCT